MLCSGSRDREREIFSLFVKKASGGFILRTKVLGHAKQESLEGYIGPIIESRGQDLLLVLWAVGALRHG